MLSQRNFGQLINEYEVQHLLGKGGFASVYKAKCLRSYQDVAIKMIDKKLIEESGLSNRVRQEVEIHSRLKHPSILQLYTFFQDANYVYLVLELAYNGELHRFMKKQMHRPFTEKEGAIILKDVVNGLLYLHSHNIMHRDISLSNLLLSEDMRVKIADFGLATQLQRPDEKHLTMCGTPNYISPEVISRTSHGLAADVWGLGCILYTLLVGHPPFDTDGVQSTLAKVMKSDYTMPVHLSFEACDLINNLLKKNPHDRILLKQVLLHPFMDKITEPSTTKESDFQRNANCDSGIVTFTSSDSKISQRLRSVNNFIAQPLPQISEEYVFKKASNSYASTGYRCPEQHQLHEQGCDDGETANNYWEYLPTNLLNTPSPGLQMTHKVETPINPTVPPLNTKRLQPTRYKAKNAIMSIMSTGDVLLEFTKFKAKFNEDRITDVCRITQDGKRIIIYQPDPGRGLPIQALPPDPHLLGKNCLYSYHNLPAKHWKKYIYAARFVSLVKSKTPKITFFSSQAKCHLMESMSDFEMYFYSGEKILKSAKEVINVYNISGNLLMDHSQVNCKRLIDHQKDCYSHCLTISNVLETAETEQNVCFPVTIGRRPNMEPKPKTSQCLGEITAMRDCTNLSITNQKFQQSLAHFSISTNSSQGTDNDAASNTWKSGAHQNLPIKRISIPDIGIATELLHGVIQIKYHNGSVISVIPESQGGGVTYTQSNGVSTHFRDLDDLPLMVRDRLAQVPLIQQKLKNASLINNRKLGFNITEKSSTASLSNNRIIL